MNGLQIKFIIFIAVVAVITFGFAVIIFKQLNKVGKKALEAKQQQEYELQRELADEISDSDAEH